MNSPVWLTPALCKSLISDVRSLSSPFRPDGSPDPAVAERMTQLARRYGLLAPSQVEALWLLLMSGPTSRRLERFDQEAWAEALVIPLCSTLTLRICHKPPQQGEQAWFHPFPADVSQRLNRLLSAAQAIRSREVELPPLAKLGEPAVAPNRESFGLEVQGSNSGAISAAPCANAVARDDVCLVIGPKNTEDPNADPIELAFRENPYKGHARPNPIRGGDPNVGTKFIMTRAGRIEDLDEKIKDPDEKIVGLKGGSDDAWGVLWFVSHELLEKGEYWLHFELHRTVGLAHTGAELVTVDDARRLWTEYTARELALRFIVVDGSFTLQRLETSVVQHADARAGRWAPGSDVALEWRRVLEGQYLKGQLLIAVRPHDGPAVALRRVGRFAAAYRDLMGVLDPDQEQIKSWDRAIRDFLVFEFDLGLTDTVASQVPSLVDVLMLDRPGKVHSSLKGKVFGYDPACGGCAWLEWASPLTAGSQSPAHCTCGARVPLKLIRRFRKALWRERLDHLVEDVKHTEYAHHFGSYFP